MLLFLFRLIATLLHVALMFGLAPLLLGLTSCIRARLLGRSGPPLLQPYLDLWKLLHKVPLVPGNASELYKIWPFASFAAIGAVALLVPGFALNLLSAPLSDFITLIGLFTLSRAAMMLAGLETGFGFGGAAVARDVLFSIFSEAALLVVVLVLALIAGDPTLDGIASFFNAGQLGISIPLGFALVAILAVALVDTGRISVLHSELSMGREAMKLEYSGRYLALFQYAACLRRMVWCSLIATIFFPFFMAQAGNILSWPLGIIAWLLKLGILAAAFALFEIFTAQMRVFRVPEFFGGAILLGLLSAIFLFVAGRLGE